MADVRQTDCVRCASQLSLDASLVACQPERVGRLCMRCVACMLKGLLCIHSLITADTLNSCNGLDGPATVCEM